MGQHSWPGRRDAVGMAACPLQSRGCPISLKSLYGEAQVHTVRARAAAVEKMRRKGTARFRSVYIGAEFHTGAAFHRLSRANIGSGRFLRSRRRRGVLRRDQVRSSKDQVRESAVSSAAQTVTTAS
jgi:hypothetical protein